VSSSIRLALTLPIPDEFLFAIAHVVTQWAYLESHIDGEIASLRGRPECAALTPPKVLKRFRARIGFWRDIASAVHTTDEDRTDIAFIHQNATDIKPRRDEVAHNPFVAGGGDSNLMMLLQKEGQWELKEFVNGVAEISQLAERISLVNARCMSFDFRHRLAQDDNDS
jgi:hypothetical protein